MPSHLTVNGHLTANQQDEANKLNITHTEMINIVLQRLADENRERCSKNNNICYFSHYTIQADFLTMANVWYTIYPTLR